MSTSPTLGTTRFARSTFRATSQGSPGPARRAPAGTGDSDFSGDGGPAIEATLNSPEGEAVDSVAGVLIADTNNRRIRNVGLNGVINTVARRSRRTGGSDSGPGTEASLSSPQSLAIGVDDALYIADAFRNLVFRLDPTGTIEPFVGRKCRELYFPTDVAVDANRNVYVAVAPDHFGCVYIADTGNNVVLRVGPNGTITTVAGTGTRGFGGDGGSAHNAMFSEPTDLAVDWIGQIYIADTSNNRIRMIDTDRNVTTISGTGERGDSGDGGPATQATIRWPETVAVDAIGRVYITTAFENRIRMIDQSGTITTVAGGKESGFSGDGGPASVARLYRPSGVAVGIDGNLYLGDRWNNVIRRIDAAGIVSTIAGNRL